MIARETIEENEKLSSSKLESVLSRPSVSFGDIIRTLFACARTIPWSVITARLNFKRGLLEIAEVKSKIHVLLFDFE
jgi:hypothetical protein